jgi:hypothetical protein
MMQAELEGIICSGPRKGKQFTYMLLDERVPKVNTFSREEAQAKLAKRYFNSHGPAQIQDFVWWSGLTVNDAKKAIEMNKPEISNEVIDGKTYWFFKIKKLKKEKTTNAFLLPGFDEYFIGYKDRAAVLEQKYVKYMNAGGGMVNGALVINGQITGTWKRTFWKGTVQITIRPFAELIGDEKDAVTVSCENYGRFHNLPVDIKLMAIEKT